jgi:hypothetical protein
MRHAIALYMCQIIALTAFVDESRRQCCTSDTRRARVAVLINAIAFQAYYC